jgi:hypothetical protein
VPGSSDAPVTVRVAGVPFTLPQKDCEAGLTVPALPLPKEEGIIDNKKDA